MTRAIPDCARVLVKAQEGLRLKAYHDEGGVLTIGYGHTGSDVHEDDVITQAQADQLLEMDLIEAAERLLARVDWHIIASLTDNQYGALLDFVFNEGAGPDWTIWKVLRGNAYSAVPAQLNRFVYTKVGGQEVVSLGLKRRRKAECDLWARK